MIQLPGISRQFFYAHARNGHTGIFVTFMGAWFVLQIMNSK